MIKIIRGYFYYFKAMLNRKSGNYSSDTYCFFYRAHVSLENNINIYIAYLKFMRDMGENFDKKSIENILLNFHNLKYSNKRIILNLVLENDSNYNLFGVLKKKDLLLFSKESPVVANFLFSNKVNLSDYEIKLSSFYSKQKKWNEEFLLFIIESNKNICVVGNSASSLKNNIGNVIDTYSIVIRFNQYCFHEICCGNKKDIWVKSPSLKLPSDFREKDVGWIIISGPMMLYSLSDWKEIISDSHQGKKVIFVPLDIWKYLVSKLSAPPSAGILILAWLISIVGEPKFLSVAGFSGEPAKYHHASSKLKAGSRHNWEFEKALIGSWVSMGMKVL